MTRTVAPLIVAVLVAPVFIALAHAHVPFGSRSYIAAHLDESVQRGLEFLDRSDRFRADVLRGGQHPVEIWIASKILRHHPHPGFEADVREGWRSVIDDDVWRLYQNLPGEGHRRLQRRDRNLLGSAFTGESQWPFLGVAIYNGWFLYALYPHLTKLGSPYEEQFSGGTVKVWYGYGLTHRIYAYRILEAKHPQHARLLGIDRMRERAEAALYGEMWLDIFLSDLYFERVAFYLEQPSAGPVNPRWIERIIRDQNEDGGWGAPNSLRCLIDRAVGGECSRRFSAAHPTFLAVYALVQYQGDIREGVRFAKEGPRAPDAVDALRP
jgi:hypothetical protein